MPGLSNSKPNCYVCIFLKNLFSIRQADLLELKCSQDKKNPSNKQDRDQVKADSSLTEKEAGLSVGVWCVCVSVCHMGRKESKRTWWDG